jgi:hypothetical protein
MLIDEVPLAAPAAPLADLLRLGSQGQGVSEGFGADVVLEHVGGRHVNGEVEDFCRLAPKSSEVEQGPLGLQLDEQVDVALGATFSPGDGAEDAQLADAVPTRCLEEGTAMPAQLLGRLTQLTAYRAALGRSFADWSRLQPQLAAAREEETFKGRKGGQGGARLVAGKSRLGGSGLGCQLCLRETRFGAAVLYELPDAVHLW